MNSTLREKILALEKAAYEEGINVALANAEESKTYKAFEKKLAHLLKSQIEYVATEKNIESLVLLAALEAGDLKKDDGLLAEIGHWLEKFKLGELLELSVFLQWAGERGGQAAVDKLGLSGVFNLKNKELIAYFDEYARLRVETINETTKKWISRNIRDGIEQGKTPSDIAASIVSEAAEISQTRASRIVLYETTLALSTVERAASKRYGITEKIWRTSQDEKVCPICSPMEGEERDIDEPFSAGVLGEPAHNNCRCYVEWVVPKGWDIGESYWLGE